MKFLKTFYHSIILFFYFMKELFISCIQVAKVVFSRGDYGHPALIDVPLKVKTDFEIALLANLVTLTPGTLSVDISACKGYLQVHVLLGQDPESVIRSIQNGMEKKVLEATRG